MLGHDNEAEAAFEKAISLGISAEYIEETKKEYENYRAGEGK
jgi:hypothetical protein